MSYEVWDAIADARLTRMWINGDSTAEIAKAISKLLGVKITRNAVIGRAHRLDLPEHPFASMQAEKRKRIVDLYQQGVPAGEIARRVGVNTPNNIWHALRIEGVAPNRK